MRRFQFQYLGIWITALVSMMITAYGSYQHFSILPVADSWESFLVWYVLEVQHVQDYGTLALIGAVLSVGTMANGLIVLPMLAFYSAMMHLPLRWTVIYNLLAILCIGAYGYDYQSPDHHGQFDLFLEQYFFRAVCIA